MLLMVVDALAVDVVVAPLPQPAASTAETATSSTNPASNNWLRDENRQGLTRVLMGAETSYERRGR